ncbi:hypothetical protein B0H15DRAFT_944455 [Mycena belliarum]|uniref:Uncharacterized protein n=1 Tax=Mycena belliarum TaxID=1033014 RepID=A0AAD6UEP7_9AGAR|nr:hypothetical protein B0H15DRAFT_944455 [Mycena belliae]
MDALLGKTSSLCADAAPRGALFPGPTGAQSRRPTYIYTPTTCTSSFSTSSMPRAHTPRAPPPAPRRTRHVSRVRPRLAARRARLPPRGRRAEHAHAHGQRERPHRARSSARAGCTTACRRQTQPTRPPPPPPPRPSPARAASATPPHIRCTPPSVPVPPERRVNCQMRAATPAALAYTLLKDDDDGEDASTASEYPTLSGGDWLTVPRRTPASAVPTPTPRPFVLTTAVENTAPPRVHAPVHPALPLLGVARTMTVHEGGSNEGGAGTHRTEKGWAGAASGMVWARASETSSRGGWDLRSR